MTISSEMLRSISTPDHFESRVGAIEFVDGVPSGETVGTVYVDKSWRPSEIEVAS